MKMKIRQAKPKMNKKNRKIKMNFKIKKNEKPEI